MDGKQETTKLSERKKNPLLVPFLIALIGVLLLVATLFLPFASATEEYREHLQKYSEEMYDEEINMTNGDAVDFSLFEFGKMYAAAANLEFEKSIAITCLVIIATFALFVILTTLFVVLKKPIVTLIFDLLSFSIFLLIKWDFKDRGVLPSSRYDWGFAEFVCYIGFIVVVVGAVLMLVAKIKAKHQRKVSVTE